MTGTILRLFFCHLHIVWLLYYLAYVFPIYHPLAVNCLSDFYEMIPTQCLRAFLSFNYIQYKWIQQQIFYLLLLNGSSCFIGHSLHSFISSLSSSCYSYSLAHKFGVEILMIACHQAKMNSLSVKNDNHFNIVHIVDGELVPSIKLFMHTMRSIICTTYKYKWHYARWAPAIRKLC